MMKQFNIPLPIILYIFLIIFILSNTLLASPFSDVPQDHWSYDAVSLLEDKGLVEGYPDGFFQGDRPITRYEMAMVIARVIARLEQIKSSIPEIPDLSIYATEEDLELLNLLIDEYSDELNAIGVRVKNIEDSLGSVTARVSELERVAVTGYYVSVFHTSGFIPDERNTSSFGTPNTDPNTQPPKGPSVIPGKDLNIGGAPVFQGTALVNKMELNVKLKLTDSVKGGGVFTAYSTFGDKGIADWTLIPAYNPTGNNYGRENFQANLSTLWFDTDGDWDFKGSFGEFRLNKVSSRLFLAPRNIYKYDCHRTLPLNGVHFYGTLYKKVQIETFVARNINSYINFNYPVSNIPGINPELYYWGMPRYTQVDRSWYPLATPFNDGAGAIHQYSYGDISPGQYDNFLYGVWSGFDFSDGNGHIECAFLRLFEDYASNPQVLQVGFGPKSSNAFGFRGHYFFNDKKMNLYGEFNQTRFDYNLLDKSNQTGAGNLIEVGLNAEYEHLTLDGRFVYVDPNYDPFGYHRQLELVYADGHLYKYARDWKLGSLTNGLRWCSYLPNRIGCRFGVDWLFGEKKDGLVYADFLYQKQVHPTMITNDENSFQKYDFLTGLPVGGVVGANIFGNQDTEFTVNDPAKGSQFFFNLGCKYSFEKYHLWGKFSRYDFARDFMERVNFQNEHYSQDLTYTFFYGGLTYDLTDKFSIQGNFAYDKFSGIHEYGFEVDRTEFIPGAGIRYAFNKSTDFVIDYKYYSVDDNTTDGINDYNFHRVVARFVLRF